jgi:hypothetical protein
MSLAQEHGASLPHGTAIDDYLGASTRIAVDEEARERYRRWRVNRSRALTVEGVDLTHIWELEMMAECFLPAARLVHGLPLAIQAVRPSHLVASDLDKGLIPLIGLIAETAQVTAVEDAKAAPPRRRLPRAQASLPAAVADTIGVPSRVRGEVMCIPYWPLYPAITSLAAGANGLQPVAARVLLAGLGPRTAAGIAMRGGWAGLPGRRSRQISRTSIAAALQSAGASAIEDPLEAAFDSHALTTLGRLAVDTLAHVWQARRGISGSRVRLGLVPYDSDAHARMLLGVLREQGVPTLLVQHGFPARQGDPDMHTADHLAIWCEHERSLAPERDPATVTVTGNPGAQHLAGRVRRRHRQCRRSVVLVDYPGRLTARIDDRVGVRHVATALQALALARPGTAVVIRPHPSDRAPAAYAKLARGHRDLRVEIDTGTPIESLLESADLCVGSLSTGTLQGCALGVPTVFLDVAGIERPWPFDGSALAGCTDAEGLAEAVALALSSEEVAGRNEALDALGVRPDAVERVLDLVGDLAR